MLGQQHAAANAPPAGVAPPHQAAAAADPPPIAHAPAAGTVTLLSSSRQASGPRPSAAGNPSAASQVRTRAAIVLGHGPQCTHISRIGCSAAKCRKVRECRPRRCQAGGAAAALSSSSSESDREEGEDSDMSEDEGEHSTQNLRDILLRELGATGNEGSTIDTQLER